MGKLLAKFRGLVAEEVLDSIQALAGELSGRSLLHVYSGRLRADAKEMLGYLAEYFEDVGIHSRATTIVGTEEFFDVVRLTEEDPGHSGIPERWTRFYEEAMRENARKMFLSSDLVIVHGLQPLGLIEHRRDERPWLWRCHSNLAGSAPPLWSFAKRFVSRYQAALFSHTSFVSELGIQHFVIPPSIDPFSPVNRQMSPDELGQTLAHLGIPGDRPLALQFLSSGSTDEALEAIRTWKTGNLPRNAVLVLIHVGSAADHALDSELEAVRAVDPSVRVLQLSRSSPQELAALGWAAQVVVDASNSRWPNLDLLDVMWKGTPAVVAMDSASAPFVSDEVGFRMRSREELSTRVGDLLSDARTAREMGACAHLMVSRRHLVPRHLLDYLKLMLFFEERATP